MSAGIDCASTLASWCMEAMVNRTSAYGLYANGKSHTEKTPLTLEIIERHFRGELIIGIHAMKPRRFSCGIASKTARTTPWPY